MDGWITIGTKLDTKGLEKDMKAAERELQKYQKDSEKLTTQKAQIEVDLSNFEKEKVAYDELRNKASQYRQEIQRLTQERKGLSVNGMVSAEKVPEYEAQSQKIREAKQELAQINELIDKQANGIDKASFKYEEQKQKLAEINAQLSKNAKAQQELTGKIASVNEKLRRTQGIKNLSSEVGSISGKMTSILGKVARWALAIFSIRSIYSTLSSASATLAQYNEQYAANLEYIRFALAQMLAPVLEYIVRLMYTILQYINMIASAWFGVNLFANASADAFTKAKSSTGGIAKNAEKTRKELQQTNFDEMNVLQDNTASASGGGVGGGGAVAPSMDLSKMGEVEVPAWLQWIIDHKDEIIRFLIMVGTLIAGIKIFQLVKGIGQLFGGISSLKALGITAMILGIVWAVAGLIQYLKDPTWENFGKIVQGVGLTIIGLGAVIGSLPVAVIGAAILIHGTIMKNWDKIKDTLTRGIDWFHSKIEELQGWLDTKLDWLPEKFGIVGELVKETLKIIVVAVPTFFEELFKVLLDIFDKIYTGIRDVVDGIIKIFQGDFKGGMQQIGKGILNIFLGVWEGTYAGLITLWNTLKKIFAKVGEIFANIWGKFKEKAQEVFNSIKNVFAPIIDWFKNIFETALQGVKDIWNTVASWFKEYVIEPIKKFFEPLVNWFTKLFNEIKEFIKSVFNVIIGIAQGCVEAIIIIWKIVAGWFNENVVEPIRKFFVDLWDKIKEKGEQAWNGLKSIWNIVANWFNDTIINPVKNKFDEMWNKLKDGASKAWEGIKSVFSTVANFFKDTFQTAWQKVKDVFSTGGKIFNGIKEGIVTSFKNIVNGIIDGINRVVSVPFNAINNTLDILRNVEIAGYKPFEGKISHIYVPQIPRLAKGTILNNPGNGVPVAGGRAIAGEAGREAYLPLSDKQLLEELGSTIGKYITINATVNNSMNGRLISRIMQQIKTEQDFAYNT